MRAAASGRLDFSESWPREPKWYLKENYILRDISRETAIKLHELKHSLHAAAAQYVELAPGGEAHKELFDHHFDSAVTEYNIIGQLMEPWDGVWETQLSKMQATDKETLGSKSIAGLIKKYERFKANIAKMKEQKDVSKPN